MNCGQGSKLNTTNNQWCACYTGNFLTSIFFPRIILCNLKCFFEKFQSLVSVTFIFVDKIFTVLKFNRINTIVVIGNYVIKYVACKTCVVKTLSSIHATSFSVCKIRIFPSQKRHARNHTTSDHIYCWRSCCFTAVFIKINSILDTTFYSLGIDKDW